MAGTTHRDKGQNGREGGFSLIELCVVLVVISVLLGIAVVTLLGSRERAANAAAKARARDGLVAQKTFAADGKGYASADELTDSNIEPSLQVDKLDEPADEAHVLGVVYVRKNDSSTVDLVSRSNSGECYWIRETNGASSYATTKVSSDGVCAEPAPEAFTSSW